MPRPNGNLNENEIMSKTKSQTTSAAPSTARITPLGDRVLVKRLEADDKTKGGIILPDTAKEKPREGTVVAVGSGKLLDNGQRGTFTVKAKDRVLFSSYAGSEVKLDGVDYLILSEDEILAVIEN
jgi:chaperonin GroES